MPRSQQSSTTLAGKALKRATSRREASDEAWHKAIHDAHAAGLSVRAIAPLAGISHQRVHQILHGG